MHKVEKKGRQASVCWKKEDSPLAALSCRTFWNCLIKVTSLNNFKEAAPQASIFTENGYVVAHNKAAACKVASIGTKSPLITLKKTPKALSLKHLRVGNVCLLSANNVCEPKTPKTQWQLENCSEMTQCLQHICDPWLLGNSLFMTCLRTALYKAGVRGPTRKRNMLL